MKKLILLLACAAALIAATYDTPGVSGGGGGGVTWNSPVAYASIPSCSTSEFFQPLSDSPYLVYCDGSSTLHYYINGYECTLPPTSGWTSFNSPTSVTSTNGTIVLVTPASITTNLRGQTRTIASAPYTYTMLFSYTSANTSAAAAGFAMSNGTSYSTYKLFNSNFGFFAQSHTNATTSGSNIGTQYGAISWDNWALLRISDNSTNRIVEMSNDYGVSWFQVYTSANNLFHTPTVIGYFADSTHNTGGVTMTIASWKEE